MLSSSTASTPTASASSSWASVSTSTSIFTRWPTPARAALIAGAHAAGHGDMVVLDQHGIVEPEAMVDAAARRARAYFCTARRPGMVLRVQQIRALWPRTASTSVAVAWRRRSGGPGNSAPRARRSACRAPARDAWRSRSPGASRVPSGRSTSISIAGSISRKASDARSSPATTPAWRATSARLGARVGRHDRVGGDVAGAAEVLQQGGAHQRLDHDQGGKAGDACRRLIDRQHALDRAAGTAGDRRIDRHLVPHGLQRVADLRQGDPLHVRAEIAGAHEFDVRDAARRRCRSSSIRSSARRAPAARAPT